MDFWTKQLEPIGNGVPIHAPKLWLMLPNDPTSPRLGSLKERLVELRKSDRFIEELPPLSTKRTTN